MPKSHSHCVIEVSVHANSKDSKTEKGEKAKRTLEVKREQEREMRRCTSEREWT